MNHTREELANHDQFSNREAILALYDEVAALEEKLIPELSRKPYAPAVSSSPSTIQKWSNGDRPDPLPEWEPVGDGSKVWKHYGYTCTADAVPADVLDKWRESGELPTEQVTDEDVPH